MNSDLKIILTVIVAILILGLIVVNVNDINNFLSFQSNHGVSMKNSEFTVPDEWSVLYHFDVKEHHTNNMISITNGYVVVDIWEDWMESQISDKTREQIKSHNGGGYQVLKSENISLRGENISKEYYANPARNTKTTYDYIGIVYIYNKDNHYYMINIHYMTKTDYDNQTFNKELDDRVSEIMKTSTRKIISNPLGVITPDLYYSKSF